MFKNLMNFMKKESKEIEAGNIQDAPSPLESPPPPQSQSELSLNDRLKETLTLATSSEQKQALYAILLEATLYLPVPEGTKKPRCMDLKTRPGENEKMFVSTFASQALAELVLELEEEPFDLLSVQFHRICELSIMQGAEGMLIGIGGDIDSDGNMGISTTITVHLHELKYLAEGQFPPDEQNAPPLEKISKASSKLLETAVPQSYTEPQETEHEPLRGEHIIAFDKNFPESALTDEVLDSLVTKVTQALMSHPGEDCYHFRHELYEMLLKAYIWVPVDRHFIREGQETLISLQLDNEKATVFPVFTSPEAIRQIDPDASYRYIHTPFIHFCTIILNFQVDRLRLVGEGPRMVEFNLEEITKLAALEIPLPKVTQEASSAPQSPAAYRNLHSPLPSALVIKLVNLFENRKQQIESVYIFDNSPEPSEHPDLGLPGQANLNLGICFKITPGEEDWFNRVIWPGCLNIFEDNEIDQVQMHLLNDNPTLEKEIKKTILPIFRGEKNGSSPRNGNLGGGGNDFISLNRGLSLAKDPPRS